MNEENYEEQGLSLGDLLFLVKRNILLIVIITFICTLIGGIYGLGIKETKYTAVSTAIVEMPTSGNDMTPSNISGSLYLINSFKDFIKSQPVLTETIKTLGYEGLTIESLNNSVTITTTTNSLLLTITAVTNDPEKSMEIANTLLDEAIEYANALEADGSKKFETLNKSLKKVESATSTTAKRGASIVIIVSFLIGLVISFVIVLIKYLTDDTYTSKDSFEKAYNINILASIEDAEGSN